MNWISVKDQLPPRSFVLRDDQECPYEAVMILLFIPAPEGPGEDRSEVLVGIYEEEDLSPFPNIAEWLSYDGDSWTRLERTPTHWMPLPRGPK